MCKLKYKKMLVATIEWPQAKINHATEGKELIIRKLLPNLANVKITVTECSLNIQNRYSLSNKYLDTDLISKKVQ